jgi:hypothetical protein
MLTATVVRCMFKISPSDISNKVCSGKKVRVHLQLATQRSKERGGNAKKSIKVGVMWD